MKGRVAISARENHSHVSLLTKVDSLHSLEVEREKEFFVPSIANFG